MKIVAVEGLEERKSGTVDDMYVDANRSKLVNEAGGEGGTAPSGTNASPASEHLLGSEKSDIVVVKGMGQEMLSKHPNLQVG